MSLCRVCLIDAVKANGRCNACRTYWIRMGQERPPEVIRRHVDRKIEQKLELEVGTQAEPTTLYRYFDKKGQLLYVGITGAGRKRASQHFNNSAWWAFVSSASFEHFSRRIDAKRAEARAINTEDPIFNRMPGKEQWCVVCDSDSINRNFRCNTCAAYFERTGTERPWELVIEATRRRDERRLGGSASAV